MLSVVNVFTRDTVANRQALAGQTARSELFSGTFVPMDSDVIPKEFASTVTAVYQVEENGMVTGYCFDVKAKGYDTLTMIVGVNTELIVTGVKILSQAETPGRSRRGVSSPIQRASFPKLGFGGFPQRGDRFFSGDQSRSAVRR